MTLSGVVRGVQGVVVQKRSGGGPWQLLRPVVPGSFSFAVKPKVTTEYRLANVNDAAAFIRIRVQTATLG